MQVQYGALDFAWLWTMGHERFLDMEPLEESPGMAAILDFKMAARSLWCR